MEAHDLGETVLPHDEEVSQVSPEELAQLLGGGAEQREPTELETAVAGALEEVTIPCVIELDDGKVFEVDAIRAWAWTPFGVYAVGKYADDEAEVERKVLFAGRKIANIELQTEAYEEFVASIEEVAAEDESNESGSEASSD